MPEPLNKPLYEKLQTLPGGVRISNPGIVRTVRYMPHPNRPSQLCEIFTQRGEQYRVNCPFCGDRHHRLYVSHVYGQIDRVTGRTNWKLWCCHNETACHRNPQYQDQFRALVAVPFGRRARQQLIATSDAPMEAPLDVAPPPLMELPHDAVPVTDLPEDHHAVAYLRTRGFDLVELVRLWDVRYVSGWSQTRAANRILIPVYRPRLQFGTTELEDTVVAGWQARFIGDAGPRTPKYMFPDGFQKAKILYGLPQARQTMGAVILCEGPTDVWRVGPGAIASFGLHVSRDQLLLLVHHFQGRPIVILPDSGAADAARSTADKLRAIRSVGGSDNRVVVAELPASRDDPGDCSGEEIRQAIAVALGQPLAQISSAIH